MLEPVSVWAVWYSGVPIVAGLRLALIDLLIFLATKAERPGPLFSPSSTGVTVALTAYNDEESIAEAVRDFLRSIRSCAE